MFKYLFICAVLIGAILANPLRQHNEPQAASHIVIVTPQARVHLEALPSSSYVQHLAPLTRYVSPHEEGVVYVPASGGSVPTVLPFDVSGDVRTLANVQSRQTFPEQIAQAASTAQQIAMSFPTTFPQANFSETASQISSQIASQINAANEAWTGSSGLFPSTGTQSLSNDPYSQITQAVNQIAASASSFIPNTSGQFSNLVSTPAATETQNIEYEIPLTHVLSTEPRHHHFVYAPGVVPHLVDVIQTPVVVGPTLSTVRGRSLQSTEAKTPIITIPLPASKKPEALPLQSNKEFDEKLSPDNKKYEYTRVLDTPTTKEEIRDETKNPTKWTDKMENKGKISTKNYKIIKILTKLKKKKRNNIFHKTKAKNH